ncbi:MAG: integrase core domain-containing protein [Alphaproteobacteria bacterium]|nr:integrase core domain-containing protein [Alphaproteobacteria bacterium]
MPLKDKTVMSQKKELVAACLQSKESGHSISALAREAGVSRASCYRWMAQHQAGGDLSPASTRPDHSPRKISGETEQQILDLHKQFPHFGSRKIKHKIKTNNDDQAAPSHQTIVSVLRNHGLIKPRKKSRKFPPRKNPLTIAEAPNDVFAIDFKGDFLTQDGVRNKFLTMMDCASRYVFLSRHLDRMTTSYVLGAVIEVFQEYGLPLVMRSDGGSPFGTTGYRGFSALSLNCIKLGIHYERITPGRPQENGRLERYHRTLKEETMMPPAATAVEQQTRTDGFVRHYNEGRPHQALNFATPHSQYTRSPRKYPGYIPEVEYSNEYEVRKVCKKGLISFRGEEYILSKVFQGEPIGLLETPTGDFDIYFGVQRIGGLYRNGQIFEPLLEP